MFYEPKQITLLNTQHFVEEITEIVQHVSKFGGNIIVD
jgi:hypothetical protein